MPLFSSLRNTIAFCYHFCYRVEQQVMARVVTGMFPQPAQADPARQSEPENSVASDIGKRMCSFY